MAFESAQLVGAPAAVRRPGVSSPVRFLGEHRRCTACRRWLQCGYIAAFVGTAGDMPRCRKSCLSLLGYCSSGGFRSSLRVPPLHCEAQVVVIGVAAAYSGQGCCNSALQGVGAVYVDSPGRFRSSLGTILMPTRPVAFIPLRRVSHCIYGCFGRAALTGRRVLFAGTIMRRVQR